MLEALALMELTDVDRIALEIAAVATAVEVGNPAVLREGGPTLRFGNALLDSPESPETNRRAELLELAHLWDPEVGVADTRPVDLVIGNPPWERVRVEPRSLLRGLLDQVANDTHKASRDRALEDACASHPNLARYLEDHLASTAAGVAALRRDPRLRLSTKGEIYTHALFTELSVRRTAPRQGWSALLVKSALMTSAGHQSLSRWLLDEQRVAEVWDFRNSHRVFDIDSRERFAALMMGPPRPGGAWLASGLTEVAQLGVEELRTRIDDDTRRRLSPGAQVLPATVGRDLGLLLELGDRPTLLETYPEARFGRLLHLTNPTLLPSTPPQRRAAPCVGGPDDRSVNDESQVRRPGTEFAGRSAGGRRRGRGWLKTPSCPTRISSQRRVGGWMPTAGNHVASRHPEPYSLVWRNASSPFNRRTLIATVLPRVPTIQSLQLLQLREPRQRR